MILILEDNEARLVRFRQTAARIAPKTGVKIWNDAASMIDDLYDDLGAASVMSLDHDLMRTSSRIRDPGTGYDVVQLLAKLEPCCPIIVHTSNGERGSWMTAELRRSKWRFIRVYPTDADWIGTSWADALRQCLARD